MCRPAYLQVYMVVSRLRSRTQRISSGSISSASLGSGRGVRQPMSPPALLTRISRWPSVVSTRPGQMQGVMATQSAARTCYQGSLSRQVDCVHGCTFQLVKYLRLKAGGLSLTPKSRNDRPLDGRPTQDRCTILSKRSQILLSNVVAGVQVSIELIPALTAEEEALRTAIGTVSMPTTRAGLTGMPGVNLGHLDTAFLCLVHGKIVQLGKCPAVQLPLVLDILVLLASAHMRRLTNIGEVLKDEGSSWRGVLNEAFGENMICVPAESPLLARQLLEMSFRRLCSFGLQLSLDTKTTALDLFPVLASQEAASRGHSGAIEAKIN